MRRITGIGRGRRQRRRRDALSANARKLFATEAVEDAFGADDAAESDLPGGRGTDVTDQGGRAAGGGAAENVEGAIGLRGGKQADETALVGDVERFKAEDFAGATDEFGDGHGGFVDGDGELRGFGDFDERGRETPAGEVAQAVDFETGGKEGLHGGDEGGAVALDGALEGEVGARGHDRHAVAPQVAAEDHGVSRADGRGGDGEVVLDHADAGGGDVEAVAFAALDDFGIAGDDGDAGGGGGVAHGGDDALERGGGETFFEDKAGTEPERAGAAHAEIIDGAVDGELADVAAGEEERTDDVRIRCERETRAAGGENGAVVLGVECGVGEGGAEDLVDEVLGESAAATVADGDFGAMGERHRAGGERGGGGDGRWGEHGAKLGAGDGGAEENDASAARVMCAASDRGHGSALLLTPGVSSSDEFHWSEARKKCAR